MVPNDSNSNLALGTVIQGIIASQTSSFSVVSIVAFALEYGFGPKKKHKPQIYFRFDWTCEFKIRLFKTFAPLCLI